MDLITDSAAARFYSQLEKLNEVEENLKSKQVMKVCSLLENIYRTATKNDLQSNSKFFERMQYVFDTYSFHKHIVDMSHNLRKLGNDVRHNGLEPNIKDYHASIEAVAENIQAFSNKEIPIEVQAIYNEKIIVPKKEDNTKSNQSSGSNKLSIREKDLVNNPTPRLAVALCLDTSGSMENDDKIGQLNKGVKMFFQSILEDELAQYSVEISVVTFSSKANMLLDFENVERQQDKMKSFNLTAHGLTSMGEAVELSLKLLNKRKDEYKTAGVEYYQPWLVLMTDGQPTDNITEATRLTNELITEKKLSLFPIGIGDGANMRTLSSFSTSRQPLKLKGLNFQEFFEWLGQSVKNTSQSTPGDQIKLPTVNGWAEV